MSFVQVRSSSGSSKIAGVDRTPFYGARIPDEVKDFSKQAKNVDMKLLKTVIGLCLEGNALDGDAFSKLSTDSVSEETLRRLYAGIQSLSRASMRIPDLKADVFKEDLSQLKLRPEVVDILANSILHKKKAQQAKSIDSSVRLPQIQSLRWRVDVGISTSSLNRVLEPYIMMEMTLSSGEIKTFEVSVSKFHELRYSVAYVLKEMEDLEKRNILTK